jgi:hypothetical protein
MTIFNEDGVTVQRVRRRKPGEMYLLNDPEDSHLDFSSGGGVTDDALLAILLDRAEIRDDRKRVTMLKKLKTGDDERGKAKRGPGRPRKDA